MMKSALMLLAMLVSMSLMAGTSVRSPSSDMSGHGSSSPQGGGGGAGGPEGCSTGSALMLADGWEPYYDSSSPNTNGASIVFSFGSSPSQYFVSEDDINNLAGVAGTGAFECLLIYGILFNDHAVWNVITPSGHSVPLFYADNTTADQIALAPMYYPLEGERGLLFHPRGATSEGNHSALLYVMAYKR